MSNGKVVGNCCFKDRCGGGDVEGSSQSPSILCESFKFTITNFPIGTLTCARSRTSIVLIRLIVLLCGLVVENFETL